MAKIGIVGHEAAKFTDQTKAQALAIIRDLLAPPGTVVVSGRCPLGGVDVWAEEIAAELGREPLIYPPKANAWETGFKPRNIQIAEASDELHCIVVETLPASYRGRRFPFCYHCGLTDHIKSGGCWTAKYAQRMGKPAYWHIIKTVAPSVQSD